jgi:hypothetical protein
MIDDRMRPEERDWYIEHMRRTMDWIDGKIREVAEESDRQKKKPGYDCAIYVEARWLQQLIAESVGNYQMCIRLQRDLAYLSRDFNRIPTKFIVDSEKP